MTSKAILICWEELEYEDLNILKLLRFLGVDNSILYFSKNISEINYLSRIINELSPCVILSCRTLNKILQKNNYSSEFKSYLFQKITFLLIYSIFPDDFNISSINYLTDQTISSLSYIEDNNHNFEVNSYSKEICRQFSSLSFGPINNKVDFIFETRDNANNILSLISINKKPFFISMKRGNCHLFLIANKKIINIEKEINGLFQLRDYYSQIIPVLMFIKYVFRDKCWNCDGYYANFIIDDPLLRENYGFINYKALLNSMEINNFSTSIAFIPFNYKRSKKNVTRLFNRRSDKFSICVHGYNHTQNEFGTTDIKVLNSKIKGAITKMQNHEDITGVKFDKVMVFPQGVFSSMAMRILKCNNFLAAVNSEVLPFNENKNLKISNFLEPAILGHENFPLFLRRYPSELADFALDMFLGKPVLIVEHHDYFRNGYDKIRHFVRHLNSIEKIEWTGLSDIIKHHYLKKKGIDGKVYVKIYTNNAIIRNDSDIRLGYIIFKEETSNVAIINVTFNEKIVSYQIKNGILSVSVEIEPQSSAQIKILYQNTYKVENENEELSKKIKIYTRRYLSEFRDNIISRNEILLNLVHKIISFISKKVKERPKISNSQ